MKTVAAMMVAMAVPCAFAAVQPVVDTDEVFPAAYTEDYELDGNLDKPVWKTAKVLPQNMYRLGKPLPYKDEIRVLWSKTALYIGATMWQDVSKALFKWDQRDMPTWVDDNLELFLFIPLEDGRNGLFQFVVNPLGTVADLLDGNVVWSNDGIETVAKRYDDRWTLECRIPFVGMMDRPVSGDFIGARFCRWIHDGKKSHTGTTPYLIDPGNDQRRRFAKLLFSPPTGEGAEAILAADRKYAADLSRKRFYKRYDAFVKWFDEVRGGTEYFKRSRHLVYAEPLAKVRGMAERLEAFERSHEAALAGRKPIDKSEADVFLADADAFERYANEHAYVVWMVDPWSNGSETDLPAADAKAMPEKLAFEQAGNEREQICLAIHGLLCGSRLDLRLWPESLGANGSPASLKEHYLSTDSFEVYLEPFVQIEGQIFTMPLVRAPGNMVTVTPGRTVRAWFAFNSRGVPADTYKTELKFKPLNDLKVAARAVPVEVKVWRFSLPETRDWPLKSFFWGTALFGNDEVAQLEMAHDHHITHGWTQFYRYQYGMFRERNVYWSANKGKAKINPDHDFDDEVAKHGNQKFLEKARELGMRFVIGWSCPQSLDWYKTMVERLDGMGFAREDCIFKGLLRDEFVKEDIPKSASRREAVWNWRSDLHFQATLLSTPPPTGASIQDMVNAKLPQFYTQWTVIDSLLDDPVRGPETVKMIRDAGKQVWSYNCTRFMHRQEIWKYYRSYPWRCWLRGLDGVAMWAFNSPQNDGWDSRDGFDDGITWRGLDRKNVPTKHLAAFREGLEDVAYMDALEKALVRAESAAGDCRPPAALIAEAKRLLAERAEIVKGNDQKKVDAWRLAVGRAIDSLAVK